MSTLTHTPSTTVMAHWCASRLRSHGWQIVDLGCDEDGRGFITIRKGGGSPVTICDWPLITATLEGYLCGLLSDVGAEEGSQRRLRHLAALLLLGCPADRVEVAALRPWPIPDYTGPQPCETVLIAYWLASTLIDDYRWRITDLNEHGFGALTASGEPETFTPGLRRNRGTTGDALAHMVCAMTAVERAALRELLDHHQQRFAAEGARR